MRRSKITALLDADIQTVWNITTDNSDYRWRSDLERIEILDENRFVEYTKTGNATYFTITHMEPYKRYEFDMGNKFFNGHWTGIYETVDGKTRITFTEKLHIHSRLMEFLSYFFMNLKKIQKTYVGDLRKRLAQEPQGKDI